MKKYLLLIIGLYMAVFRLYARERVPVRIETKSFSDVAEIRFDHSFGNITVTESDSKQVELEIRYFYETDAVQPVCNISATGKYLKIKTDIPKNTKTDRMGIDYIIAVPKNVDMKIDTKFGNVLMGDFYGDLTCKVAFGNLNVNKLFKSPPHISGEYSVITIDEVDVLNLSADFSTVNINTVAEMEGKLHFSPTTVDYLGKKLDLKCNFSETKIKNSSRHLESIRLAASYSNLTLSLDADLSAELNVDLEYGNLSVADKYRVRYTLSETGRNKTVKRGTVGSKTPAATIVISNSFANVSIR